MLARIEDVRNKNDKRCRLNMPENVEEVMKDLVSTTASPLTIDLRLKLSEQTGTSVQSNNSRLFFGWINKLSHFEVKLY